MALRLRSNGAPLSGALFVSNPRKRKTSRKARRKAARKRNTAARKAAAPKRNRRNRRNTAAAKARRAAALRSLRNRRNKRKTARTMRNRRNALAMKMNRRNRRNRRNTAAAGAVANRRRSAAKRNRRNGTRKGMVRKTARRAYTRRRRNTNAVSAFSNRVAAPIQRIVGKVPVIGSIAKQFVAPLVIGAAAGAVHYYGVKALQRYAPGVAAKVQPVQFTVAGSLVAGILLAGNKIPGIKKISAKTRQQIAAAALILGGGLDTYRALSRRMGDLGEAVPLYDYSGLAVDLGEAVPLYDYSGLGVDLGDGGAYDVVPLAGISVDGEVMDYNMADFADAMAAPDDLSVEEGEMALAGPAHYAAAFGPCPVTRSRRGGLSSLAGKPGHRFGWLIKLVGFQRFQQIAALPPQQRVALIQKMKQQAIAIAEEAQVEQQASSLGGLGVDLGGLAMDFGAHMHAGSAF